MVLTDPISRAFSDEPSDLEAMETLSELFGIPSDPCDREVGIRARQETSLRARTTPVSLGGHH